MMNSFGCLWMVFHERGRDRRQERGQHDQPERDAVDAEVVVDLQAKISRQVRVEAWLKAGSAVIKVRGQMQRDDEREMAAPSAAILKARSLE